MTRIELKTDDGTYTIEHNEAYPHIGELFEFVIEPLLRAAGYSQELIDNYLEQDK